MTGTMKNKPARCCCTPVCPDCEAPTPVSTGSTDPETAWYLTPYDTDSTPYRDRATSYFVKRTDPLSFVNFAETEPTRAWTKFRCYFADTCYAEMYGVYYFVATPLYQYDWYLRVVAGDQIVDAGYINWGSHAAAPQALGIGVTYDEVTGIARVVGAVTTNGLNGCQLYAKVNLSDDYYGGSYGLRYGWGYGAAYNGIALAEPETINETASRYIDFCQSFPAVNIVESGRLTMPTHGWLKSSHLTIESITADIAGIPDCDDANGTFTLGRASTAIWSNNSSSAFTLDLTPRYGNGRYGQLLGDYIPTGWITPSGSPLGAGREWVICPELEIFKLGVNKVRFGIRGRTRKAPLVPGIIYPEGYEYTDHGLIAYSEATFQGHCDQYHGADAIDGLVFEDWTVATGNGLPADLDEMTAETSV